MQRTYKALLLYYGLPCGGVGVGEAAGPEGENGNASPMSMENILMAEQ